MNRKYDAQDQDWDKLLDGNKWAIIPEKSVKISDLRSWARYQARKRGLKIRTGLYEAGIWVQATDPTDVQPPPPRIRFSMEQINPDYVFERGPRSKYPWYTYLNGKKHVLERGVHFHVAVGSFIAAARIYAKSRGLGVTVRVSGDIVTLQSRPGPDWPATRGWPPIIDDLL